MGRRSINGHSRKRRNKASALKRAMAVEATEIETPGSMQVDMSSSPMKATKEELLAGDQSGMESHNASLEKAETRGKGGYDEAIQASGTDQAANEIIDNMPIFQGWAQAGKAVGEFGTDLIVGDTEGEDRMERQKVAAAIFSPHKLAAMHEADKRLARADGMPNAVAGNNKI
tara:strand:- start:1972 stop:2487 length:516 start_codon:yes stop_codon:yes gene_type:complete